MFSVAESQIAILSVIHAMKCIECLVFYVTLYLMELDFLICVYVCLLKILTYIIETFSIYTYNLYPFSYQDSKS